MLFARLQLLAPEARTVLLAAPRGSPQSEKYGRSLVLAAIAAGSAARLLVIGPQSEAVVREDDKMIVLPPETLGTPDAARQHIAASNGELTVVAGRGLLDDPSTFIASSVVDAVIVVIERTRDRRVDLSRVREQVGGAGGTIVGSILI